VQPAQQSRPSGPTPGPADRELDLLVVGDANPDLVLRGDVVPAFGQAEQLLDAADLVLAGSAGITAAGAARLGVRTALAAHVGADPFGDLVRSELAARGVDTGPLVVDRDLATGLSVILSRPDDRAILTFLGAIDRLTPDDVPDELLARTRHVHVASWFLIPALAEGGRRLLERARAAGCSTSLDTNWDPARRWAGVREALPLVDVLLPNRAELLALAGGPASGAEVDVAPDVAPDDVADDAVERAARRIRALGPLVAMKAGADGAIGWDAAGRHHRPGVPVAVVDTTGAGDSFDAGFLAGWLAGLPFAGCLRWAAVAGSLSTRAAGGTTAQAHRDEVLALADER
jgi:sugar/nucleoside kinase (ribokinase family)